MAQRIQLRRTKGWRKPGGAIVVARPSLWGNRFRVGEPVVTATGFLWIIDNAHATALFRDWLYEDTNAAEGYRDHAKAELCGHDLCCWCPLDEPCHADVLLELANP